VAGAIAVSAIGDWVAMIALGIRTNELWMGGGVAVFLICLWSPLALLAGHVGLLVDRVETRSLAIWSALFQAAVATALAFATSLAEIYPLAVVLGIGIAVSGAAEFALIPLLAGSREIGRANGLVESARSVGFVAGPAIGGLVAGAGGTKYAMLADAATFLVIGLALATLHVRRRPVPSAVKPRARDGITLLFADRVLAVVLGFGAVTLVFMSASIPADFAYAKNVLGVGDFAFGCVLTAWAVGLMAASLTLPRRISPAMVASTTLLAAAVQGLGKFIAPFWLSYGFMVVCWTVGGMGHGVKNTGFRTLIQRHAQLGRARRARARRRTRRHARRARHALDRRRHLRARRAHRPGRARHGRAARGRPVALIGSGRAPPDNLEVVMSSRWTGWVGFAGLLMVLVGAMDAFQGLIAVIRKQYYVLTPNQIIVFDMRTWGWLMLIWGIVLVLAGLGLLERQGWARWFTIVAVGLNVLAELGFVGDASYPLWALTGITLSIIVLYALTARWSEVAATV